MRRRLGLLLCALAAVVPVSATVVVPMEFREAVADAALIVRGTVTDVRATTTAHGIESVATIAVDAVLKGAPETFVAVHVPGGTLGRYRRVVVGAPTFRPGQRAVFFLSRGGDGGWRPLGLTWGVARVEPDLATRRAVVRSPLLAANTSSARRIVRGAASQPMPVDEFDALVRVVVAGQRLATRRVQ